MKGWIVMLSALIIAAGAVWQFDRHQDARAAAPPPVRVTRGTVVRKATAVGRIEVEHEVPVNSQTGGILTRIFVRAGQKVEAETPLAEVRPVSTEQSILTAERSLEQAAKSEESAREYLEGKHLASQLTRFMLGDKNLQRMYESAELGRKQAAEHLEMLKHGSAKVENRLVDFLVRAPATGHVLEIKQREGSPVVPASAYGLGTVFMTLADMNHLLFRGTVDEIDVGRLREGMVAQIKVGALPKTPVKGAIVEIALKGQERNNAMVFDVLISIEPPPQALLRSGYSAVAEIEIERRNQVLTLPERVVEFRGGKAFVQIPGARDAKEIVTGLSDGLIVEVARGLAEGEEVLEPAFRP